MNVFVFNIRTRFTFRATEMGDQEPPDECAICTETMMVDSDTVILGCQHKFHRECMLRSLESKRTCPLCRNAVSSMQVATDPPQTIDFPRPDIRVRQLPVEFQGVALEDIQQRVFSNIDRIQGNIPTVEQLQQFLRTSDVSVLQGTILDFEQHDASQLISAIFDFTPQDEPLIQRRRRADTLRNPSRRMLSLRTRPRLPDVLRSGLSSDESGT